MKIIETSRILHPTDFSRGSEVAFAHALKLALVTKAELEILHVDRHPEHVPWSAFPGVRETLIRWEVLPASASTADVARLRISVFKAILGGKEPLLPILEHLEHRPADLVVLASHHTAGLDRWLHKDVANHIARLAKKTTLFVPHRLKGFVNIETGKPSLDRILVPFDFTPHPQPAIDAAEELVRLMQTGSVSCDLLHVGPDDTSLPDPHIPEPPMMRWERTCLEGDAVNEILTFAKQRSVSLIALTTTGHHGFLDALRGSTADQLLREAPCPILAVPGH